MIRLHFPLPALAISFQPIAFSLCLADCWCGAVGNDAKAALAPPRHPFLLTTPAGLERAKQRVREEDWAKHLFAGIVENAVALESEPMSVFDNEWWKIAGQKKLQYDSHENKQPIAISQNRRRRAGGPLRQ